MLPEGYQWRKKEIELSTPLCPNCSVTILQSRRTTTPINQRGIEYTSRAHVIGFVSTPYYPRLIPNVTRESVNVLWHNLFLFSLKKKKKYHNHDNHDTNNTNCHYCYPSTIIACPHRYRSELFRKSKLSPPQQKKPFLRVQNIQCLHKAKRSRGGHLLTR